MRRILAALLTLTVLGVFLWRRFEPFAPRHEGRTIRQWVAALSGDDAERAAVEAQLAKIGPIAIPALLVAMDSGNRDVRAAATRILVTFGPDAAPAANRLGLALHDENSDVRSAAVEALLRMGPAAKPAVAEFFRATQYSDTLVDENLRIALQKLR